VERIQGLSKGIEISVSLFSSALLLKSKKTGSTGLIIRTLCGWLAVALKMTLFFLRLSLGLVGSSRRKINQ
jgi:hypothetical protein